MFTGARCARSGDVNIAYQVVGSGPIDVVLVLGWVSHLAYVWELPAMAAFLERLASFSKATTDFKEAQMARFMVESTFPDGLEIPMTDQGARRACPSSAPTRSFA